MGSIGLTSRFEGGELRLASRMLFLGHGSVAMDMLFLTSISLSKLTLGEGA
jgi:hypothetical protein